jgi:hypothetical protein
MVEICVRLSRRNICLAWTEAPDAYTATPDPKSFKALAIALLWGGSLLTHRTNR